jgi:MoaA/NifB/PqqE/SkfB family radical SAM enzyme
MVAKEKIENLINQGKHFCIAPWVHLHVTCLGYMCSCCMDIKGPFSIGFGNLNKKSFTSLWQGEAIRNFRLTLLDDEAVSRCALCYNQEKNGSTSFRQELNALYKKHIAWIINTDETGFAPDARPVDWDIRFSNLCNLKCRTCACSSSSSWAREDKKILKNNAEKSGTGIIGLTNPSMLLDELNKFTPLLERVMFAGGEPLLINENYQIVKKIDALRRYDIKLYYITNMTKLQYKDQNIIELWKKFKNITIAVSLDGIGAKCEYLRKGLKWNNVLINLVKIKNECPNAKILINYTASAFNIIHLADFHREMIEKSYIKADAINLILLNKPIYYNMKILPSEMKKQVTEKIKKHITWLKQQSAFTGEEMLSADKQFESCINFLNDEDLSDQIPRFVSNTVRLDEYRKENCLEIFPELSPLF